MKIQDIAFILGIVGYIAFRLHMSKSSAPEKEEAQVEATDTKLASELQPVPAVVPPPAPESTQFTPGQATSFWNKELGENK